MNIKFVDIHSHVQFPEFDGDREEVISRMKNAGVFSVVVGTDLKTSEMAVRLAGKHENLFASVGLHPNDAISENFDYSAYRELVSNPKTVAIGECGLDYFRTEGTEGNKKKQKEIFEKQINLALEFDKPLMIHCRPASPKLREGRNAYEDMIDILTIHKKEHGGKLRGNIHFFAGDWSIAQKFLKLDFTLSFTGVITFAEQYDEVIKNAPLNMIMSETDCPYVAPTPHRGKRNEPNHVLEVVKRIAGIRGEDFEKTKEAMAKNAARVFRIHVGDREVIT